MGGVKDQDYDPKLKEAMGKIEAICEEYEVGYMCVIASRYHAEFKSDFPKWSLIQYDMDKGGIRIRTKKSDKELTNSSFHVFFSIRDVCGMFFVRLQETFEAVKGRIDVEHRPFGGKDLF